MKLFKETGTLIYDLTDYNSRRAFLLASHATEMGLVLWELVHNGSKAVSKAVLDEMDKQGVSLLNLPE